MTNEQKYLLSAAKLQLLHRAVLYSSIAVNQKDTSDAEHKLCIAAKDFARVVDGIDPKLWEPPSNCPELWNTNE